MQGGGQKKTCRGDFSPSTMWVGMIKVRSSCKGQASLNADPSCKISHLLLFCLRKYLKYFPMSKKIFLSNQM